MAKIKTKDNLLKSAVLEANQVKATAYESAKLDIERNFSKTLSNAWSKTLRESLNDPDNDGHGKGEGGETDVAAVTEQNTLDSSEIGTGDNRESDKDSRSSSDIDNPGQEVEQMGEGAEVDSDGHEEVLDQLTEDDELDLDDLEDDEEDLDDDPSTHTFDSDDLDDDESDDDLDGEDEEEDEEEFSFDDDEEDDLGLEELIRELENDVGGMEEDISDLASRDNVTQTVDLDPNLSPAGDDEEVLHLESKDSDEEDEEDEDEEDEDETLEEILREMEASDDRDDVVEALRSQVAEYKTSLKEHRNVITFLKNRLTEINMLNAKLLYTNKLFKANNLNAGEKVRVYETFDRVTTPREAKLLYTTLAEVFGSSRPKKKAGRVVESVASMPVGSTKSKTLINEGKKSVKSDEDRFKRRMQIIAGIINE